MITVVTGGVGVAVRSLMAPGVLAARWWSSDDGLPPGVVPPTARSLGVAAKIVLDEFFFLTEILTAQIVMPGERHRLRAEAAEAVEFFEGRGFLADPSAYHLRPLAPERVDGYVDDVRGQPFVHVRFASGYEPFLGEPGRERWLGYEANRTAHAWVLEHPGRPRPWIVCVPGYRMGHPLVDFTGFPAVWLHRTLGLNVAIPVMPLHGPRRVGWRSGDGFLTGDYLDTLHLQAQAVWDVRRLIAWLRCRGATQVGVYGVSLGGWTAALLAGLERDLACVITGIPATCGVRIARSNLPGFVLTLAERLGIDWNALERLCAVTSPLAMQPAVPHGRRFLFAGTVDRLVPAAGVHALWEHWGRPRLAWYQGGHVSFLGEPAVRALLDEAFTSTGLVG